MNQPNHEPWRERFWRRKLTAEQLAELRATNPDAADAKLEAALSDALTGLPDAPVPSNFTARVLQDVRREATSPATAVRNWSWVFRVLIPRAAAAMLVVGVGAFAVQQHQAKQRAGIADSLKAVAAVQALPSPEALEDFDAIRKLDSNPAADRELIALLQ
jgi:anti-sigma factor RsiW